MKAKKAIRFSLYLAAAAIMLTQSCFAYFDPATTSYIITIISAVVVACGTAVGIIVNKLKRRVKSKKNEEEAPQNILPANEKGENVVITAEDLLSDDDSGDSDNK